MEIFVPPPNYEDRLNIISTLTRQLPLGPEVNLARVASSCQGYTAADLHSLIAEVTLSALGTMEGNAVRPHFLHFLRFDCSAHVNLV